MSLARIHRRHRAYSAALALFTLLISTSQVRPARAELDPDTQVPITHDSDDDGIPDRVEIDTGTRPLRADTDRDGVPDGVEDVNQDGIVDPGESDPRVSGLFPGTYPHIPEPLAFDLVRGLGAREGEIEVNTLAYVSRVDGKTEVRWAPEAEWAFADDLAVEVELPMHERELHALKGAFQATLPVHLEHVTHGVQVIGEYLLSSRDVEATLLYIVGGRVQRWSFLTMAGARATTPMNAAQHYEALLNPSVYGEVSEALVLGVEGNVAIGNRGRAEGAILPQVHVQLSRRLRIQVGGGVALRPKELAPVLATRVVLE
jgi:hypothetical protein